MNNFHRPARRSVDGPSIAHQPISPGTSSTQPSARQSAQPVFEYEKPPSSRLDKLKGLFTKKRVLIGIGLIASLLVVFFLAKVLLATRRIIARNASDGAPALAGDIDPSKLRGEGDGRVNILLLGVGGPGHQGADLSDTIMVVSIDPSTKDVAMLGIPRDMYVPIPGYGSTKVNHAHAYGEQNKYPGGGPELAKKTMEKVLDLPIHYYARIDFNGFKKMIDAVGGVDLTVDKPIYDPYFPADRGDGYKPFSVKAGYQHMNGDTALRFVRSRYTTSDFDRASRQQKVLVAFRERTLSLGTLTNPVKLTSLIDAIGTSAKTDLQPGEIKKLAEIARDIDTSKIISKVLDTSADPSSGGLLVASNMAGAGYVEVPRVGVGNFSEIREFVHSIFVDSYLKQENAAIEVQNGTTRQGLANTVAKTLKAYNYNILRAVTADNQNYPATIIYDYTDGRKPYTVKYLETRFKTKARKASPPPAQNGEVVPEIRVVLGADYRLPTGQ